MPPEEQKTSIPPLFSGRLKRDAWEIIRILLISFVIVVPIRYFIAQPFIVRGASMEPSFADREYLIIDEVSYYFRDPARGEVVVFRYPNDPRQYFIKRIIGLPGEHVRIADGEITIYSPEQKEGFRIGEPYVAEENRPTRPSLDIQLGKNEYYVLGDNRDESSDSRIWGPLARELITGRVLLRAWPPSRFGSISIPF